MPKISFSRIALLYNSNGVTPRDAAYSLTNGSEVFATDFCKASLCSFSLNAVISRNFNLNLYALLLLLIRLFTHVCNCLCKPNTTCSATVIALLIPAAEFLSELNTCCGTLADE